MSDPVRIERQFPDGFDVIEDRHNFVGNDGELLLFERVQPAHKDMGFDARFELARCQGSIDDRRVQIASAMCRHVRGKLVQQVQCRRDVVRRKAPQYVFFGAQFAEVQA